VRVGTRLIRAAAAGESPAQLMQEAGEEVRDYARHFLGMPNGSDPLDAEPAPPRPPDVRLRERGAELLARSADVDYDEPTHPAFARILDELAPDEARILVMLLKNGPQPSVDVRTGGPIGAVSSSLIAPGLNMVGPRAGLRYLERVPAYLNNLFRLGLVWFSREALHDHLEYQVLEAQPDVLQAIHSVRFAKIVRRSIHLTPFGEDFVREALVDEVTAASDLPGHDAPAGTEVAPPPNA
jgi:hypothetical protein